MIRITTFGSGSAGNSYLIDDGFSQLILEAGVPLKTIQQKMGHDLSKVAGVLITHEHRDHCKYIKSLVDATSVDFYATNGTIEAMFQDSVLKLKQLNKYRFCPMQYKETTKIGTWYITPFETKHDVAEPCGFLIDNITGERLVFITDSYYVKYQFPRVTHMMVEANYSEEIIEKKHKSLQNVNCLFCQLLKILNSYQNFCFFCGKTNLFCSLFAVLELFNQSIKHQKSKNKYGKSRQ